MRKARPLSAYTPIGDLLVNLDHYWRHQMPPDERGCVAWSAGHHAQGYPMMGGFRDGRRIMTLTHRITAMLKFGRALEPKEFVVHTCSNTNCLNPDHIILGDYYTRNAVMIANGRAPDRTGPRGPYKPRKKKNDLQEPTAQI